MAVQVLSKITETTATSQDIEDARKALAQLSEQSAFARVLVAMVESASHGECRMISSAPEEFTPEEAADYLNVSRPYVSRLIKHGILAARKVGNRNRISLDALRDYQQRHEEAAHNYAHDISSYQQEVNDAMDDAATITTKDKEELTDLWD